MNGILGNDGLLQAMRNCSMKSVLRRGLWGWRFEPTFRSSESEGHIVRQFGPHNHACKLIYENDAIVGVRLHCQCDSNPLPDQRDASCLLHQCEFTLRTGVQLIGVGAGSQSILFTNDRKNEVRTRQRGDTSELEDFIVAQKARERAYFEEKIATLERQIQELKAKNERELKRKFQQATGGLVRDKRGRLWTRQQLIAMSEQQQAELNADHAQANPAMMKALMGTL